MLVLLPSKKIPKYLRVYVKISKIVKIRIKISQLVRILNKKRICSYPFSTHLMKERVFYHLLSQTLKT